MKILYISVRTEKEYQSGSSKANSSLEDVYPSGVTPLVDSFLLSLRVAVSVNAGDRKCKIATVFVKVTSLRSIKLSSPDQGGRFGDVSNLCPSSHIGEVPRR